MKTDDALRDIADFFIRTRRNLTDAELDTLLSRHCRDKAEKEKFSDFMQSTPGQRRLSTLLRERKEATEKSYLKEPGQAIAEELGLRYDGVQEEIGLQFTDPKTGSTFYGNSLEEARINLAKMREAFDEAEGKPSHSSNPGYHEPTSVPEALQDSMAEETTAADWYRRRAEYSEGEGDKKSAGLWKHVAGEEDTHHTEFQERLEQLRKASGQRPSYLKMERYKGTVDDIHDKVSERIGSHFTIGAMDKTERWPVEGLWYQMLGYALLDDGIHYIVFSWYRDEKGNDDWDSWSSWEKVTLSEARKLVREFAKEQKLEPPHSSQLVEPTMTLPTGEKCEVMSPEYYHLLSWFNIPLPDYSFSIEPEAKERKIDAVLKQLQQGVERIQQSDTFRQFLITMSKFHSYSFGNQILIMLQKPNATRVAGFNTWKDLGRYVKRGESGIAILAPCLPAKILACPVCGQGFTERDLRVHIPQAHPGEVANVADLVRRAKEGAEMADAPTFFKVVYVFDVSQTEGKPLPEVEVPELTGAANEELFSKLMDLAKSQGVSVSFESRPTMPSEVKGEFRQPKDIWVRPEEGRAQQLKTLAHEMAHYFTESVFGIPRADAETIAESVAFVVSAHWGFDTGTRSFSYVAIWSQDKKVLERNLKYIREVSERIIRSLGGQ